MTLEPRSQPAARAGHGSPARTRVSAREQRRARLLGRAWALGMRALAATWRLRVSGLDTVAGLEARGERAMIVLWHGQYRPLLAAIRHHPSLILSTDTYRGHIIRAAARGLGHDCVLRPPELAGRAALHWMRRELTSPRPVVIVADGPSGPARRTKSGVVKLAAALGLRIVPAASACRPALRRARWDRQEIPLPFARVGVAFGSALPSPPSPLSGAERRSWQRRVSAAIDASRAEAAHLAGAAQPAAARSRPAGP